MLTKITKSCSVRLNGEVKELKAGETITLPGDKSQRLIVAGYAETIKPDIEEYRRLAKELAERDPKGGCWDWNIEHNNDKWREFLQAFMGGNIAEARKTFNDMVSAWENRSNGGP